MVARPVHDPTLVVHADGAVQLVLLVVGLALRRLQTPPKLNHSYTAECFL